MGESSSEFGAPLNGARTLVLVGRTGNGKSATGNSILGKKEFLSRTSSTAVTSTSELRTTVIKDGQMLNVIDTPGLFDPFIDIENSGKEIVKCINMAREGIHAVLLVLSVRNLYSNAEQAVISNLRNLFGNRINDYIIVVFTGGDELEENEETLESFVQDCVVPLKETLSLCGDRCVLFDNRTKDQKKRAYQLEELLSLVNMVLTKNNGKPYTNEIFSELKIADTKLHEQTEEVQSSHTYSKQELSGLTEQMHKSHEEERKRITEMVESRLKESTFTLEQHLAEVQIANLKAKFIRYKTAAKLAYVGQMKSNVKIP